jgi:anti-anti-sigma factor
VGVTLERPAPRTALLVVEGALDHHAVEELETALGQAVGEGAVGLVIDLSGALPVDDGAPGLLVRAVRVVRPEGGTVALVTADEALRGALSTMGLDRILRLESDREAALTAVGRPVELR